MQGEEKAYGENMEEKRTPGSVDKNRKKALDNEGRVWYSNDLLGDRQISAKPVNEKI